MPRLKFAIVLADSLDIGQYDRLAWLVKSKGFKYMCCGTLSEPAQEQIYDEKDLWLRWTIESPGLMKTAEAWLVKGILSKAHIDKNAALRALRRTQRNVLRSGSIIEFFTGEKKDEYWHVLRTDEYCYEPAILP